MEYLACKKDVTFSSIDVVILRRPGILISMFCLVRGIKVKQDNTQSAHAQRGIQSYRAISSEMPSYYRNAKNEVLKARVPK